MAPRGQIAGYANKVPFSLIVMATHGRTGSSIPILMVRPAAAGAAPPAKDMAGRRA